LQSFSLPVWSEAENRVVRLQGAAQDITERKVAEAALRESEERLRLAQSAARIGIWDYDMKTRRVVWTPEQEALFGFAPGTHDGVIGTFEQLIHPEDRSRVEQAIANALAGTGTYDMEFRATRRDGALRWFAGYGQIYRNAAGQPARMVGINFDITEKKQMEADYLRVQRMEGIGALAGGIAHDLNNILAPILMIGPLLRNTVSDDESRHLIDTVESCAQRGADIIKQLLTFARGKPGVRAPLPARHLLNEMQKIMRETFPRNIQSGVDVPKDLWLIMGDATQIHQALMNLCVNARDAMPEGGKLILAAVNVTLDEVSAAMVSGSKPGEYVRLSVTDTGAGIAPEDLEHVFDPFFTTKEIGKGTGLGLPTVLGIVRGHGGFVQVDSKVGQGTGIELYFPASRDAKADGTPERELPVLRGLGELILVVDDEVTVREAVRSTLELHGYRVAVAAEGTEALAIYENRRTEIRAVVTDMMMAGMDGPKLVKALRQLDVRLPVIGMTGLSERAGMKGMDALKLPVVLTKPFSGPKLLAALNQALGRSPAAPEARLGEGPKSGT
jgi:PAS domain S-box-containing protein